MEHHDRSGIVLPQASLSRGPQSYQRRAEPRLQPAVREFRLTTAADLAAAAAAGGTPGEALAPVNLDSLRPGATVMHPEYGIGRIVAVEGAGPNRKGRVSFTLAGERTFVLARSPLRPIGKTK
jgi:DNA helicase-2/ATP-dependent DNA helicase PcrA